jgi:ABC-2 type transport system ATP-binding protein
MRQLIRAENERGATVFFSSHILEQVEAICDRVAILNKGRIVTVDTIAGLRDTAGTATQLSIRVDTVPEGAIEAIEVLDGVQSVRASGTTVIVRIEDGSKTAILDVLESAGAEVLDFSTAETSLEELFAQFTTDSTVETDDTVDVAEVAP